MTLEDEETTQVSLRPGEEHVLRLPARGSAGYDWYPELEGPPGVIDVKRSSESPARGPAGSPPRTASTDTLIHIRGMRPGDTALMLEHRRPREAGGEPLERKRILVEVVDA